MVFTYCKFGLTGHTWCPCPNKGALKQRDAVATIFRDPTLCQRVLPQVAKDCLRQSPEPPSLQPRRSFPLKPETSPSMKPALTFSIPAGLTPGSWRLFNMFPAQQWVPGRPAVTDSGPYSPETDRTRQAPERGIPSRTRIYPMIAHCCFPLKCYWKLTKMTGSNEIIFLLYSY